jgi:5-methylcytosine-specific restriction enzyme subunit McrC
MLRHIFYWLSYCRKWRFPFNKANLDNRDIDQFPELLIYLMANQFLETITTRPLMQYQSVEETLTMPRGSINFNRYINLSLAHGNNHLIECDHEPFMFDNKINRIIKYCSRLLLNQTKYIENLKLLQEVIFVLDEVEDQPITIQDINSVQVNAFYEDYQSVMDMCKTVVNMQIYNSGSYDHSQWSILFPMEYIFEDFLAGFLERHFSDGWKVEYQKSDAYLTTNPKAFQMRHDIYLTSKGKFKREIIIDIKYKIRSYDQSDLKKGITNGDIYQVIGYAYRRGCTEVFLFYPNKGEQLSEPATFEIQSGFSSEEIISVTAVEIPFWSYDLGLIEGNLKRALTEMLTIEV